MTNAVYDLVSDLAVASITFATIMIGVWTDHGFVWSLFAGAAVAMILVGLDLFVRG